MPNPDYPESGTCKTCKWWTGEDENRRAHFDERCVRLPPVVVYRQLGARESIDIEHCGLWPETSPDEWCGEYTPKQEQSDV